MSRQKEWKKIHENSVADSVLMRESIRKGQINVVRSLLELRFHPDDCTRNSSPLSYAIDAGNAEIVRMLLDAGADPSFGGPYWCGFPFGTPLHSAASDGHAEIVKLLLERGADVNATNEDHYGIMPLHEAILKGHADCVRLLLQYGADAEACFYPDFDDDHPDCTPLTMAIQLGNEEVVRALAEGGANVNAPNAAGEHPLCMAIKLNRQDIIYSLAEVAETDLNAPDECGAPGIFRFIAEGDKESVAQLLCLGADPNVPLSKGLHRPLHEAARLNQAAMIELLLQFGANPALRNRDGLLPLELATSHRCRALLQV